MFTASLRKAALNKLARRGKLYRYTGFAKAENLVALHITYVARLSN